MHILQFELYVTLVFLETTLQMQQEGLFLMYCTCIAPTYANVNGTKHKQSGMDTWKNLNIHSLIFTIM